MTTVATTTVSNDTTRRAVAASSLFAVAVALIAMTVLLLGWGAGIEAIVRIRAGFAAMVPTTALCFVLLSGALLLRNRAAMPDAAVWLAMSAAVIAAVQMLVLAIGGPQLDTFVLAASQEGDAMAFSSSASVLLAAACIAGLCDAGPVRGALFDFCATLGLLAALVALVGYVFDTAALYEVFVFTAMALHTAAAFALLFLAILLARANQGWIAVLLGDGTGSAGGRRLFPLAVAGPLVFCLLTLWSTEAGYFSANFRLSLLVIALMTLAGAAVVRNAAIENRAESRLLAAMTELEQTSADRALLLREVYHRVKNNLQQINAMLRIEARKVNDPRLTSSYDAMTDRIRALGTVHQMLISAPSPSQVLIADFLENLTGGLRRSHDLAQRGITLDVDGDEIPAHLDIAVSLGLLVNEVVTNSIKHAFGDGAGRIEVRFRSGPEAAVLTVRDDGSGAPDGYLTAATSGTGALLIRNMVAQLEGSLAIDTTEGTTVTVTMPPDINERGRYE